MIQKQNASKAINSKKLTNSNKVSLSNKNFKQSFNAPKYARQFQKKKHQYENNYQANFLTNAKHLQVCERMLKILRSR